MHLGIAYGELGDLLKKRDLIERALAIEEREFVPEHISEVCIRRVGRCAEAARFAGARSVIKEKQYGLHHRLLATTLSNLGSAHGDLGDTTRRLSILERA
mmetsp:Transcript_18875/g.61387  ORF Transcript_18875/g.61387 Transcript_18875/m.61387 type:complete len:100 (+) Transcript_18875:555-854(+)